MTNEEIPPPALMTMTGQLAFTKEGEWRHDGEPVTHRGIADYFSRHLRFSAELNRYVLLVDGRAVSVDVEDTPFVVTALDQSSVPWALSLNDGTSEPLQAGRLENDSQGVFYAVVKNGAARARFLRGVAQQLYPYITEAETGSFLLRAGNCEIPLRRV